MDSRRVFRSDGLIKALIVAALFCLAAMQSSFAFEAQRGVLKGAINDFSGSVHHVRIIAFLLRTPDGYSKWTIECEVITDTEGNYTCPPVPSGEYIILADPSDNAEEGSLSRDDTLSPTFYPGTISLESAESVRVRPNTLNVFNFPLLRSSLFQITGRILGKPTAASLQLYRLDDARTIKLSSGLTVGYDSATGSLIVRGVPMGHYLLAGNWYFGSSSQADSTLDEPKSGRILVTISDHDVSEVVLEAEQSASIEGRLEINGTVPGHALRLALESIQNDQQKYETAVSSDGLFGFTDLPCVRYRVHLAETSKAYVQSVTVDGVTSTSSQFALPKAPLVSLDVSLSLNSKTIAGTVSDTDFDRLRAHVVARNELTGEILVSETDLNGRFSVTGLSPGEYSLYAFPDAEGIAFHTLDGLRQYESVKVTLNSDNGLSEETTVNLTLSTKR